MDDKPKMSGKCYDCTHRGQLVWNCHSRCCHPKVDQDPLYAHAELGIKGKQHGIDNGWFMWPVNFDPIWLEACHGFEQEDTAA